MIDTKRRPVLRTALAICACAGLLTLAGPLAAQPKEGPAAATPAAAPAANPAPAPKPVAPPSPEALRLAREIAHDYIAAARADMAEQKVTLADYPIFQTAPFNSPALAGRWEGWIGVFRQATTMTIDERREPLEALIARTLAAHFNEAELRAGAELMSGPGGRYAQKIYAHETPKPPVPSMGTSKFGTAMQATVDILIAKQHGPLPPEAEAALAKLKSTEAGRAFLNGVLNRKAMMADYIGEYVQLIMPPFMTHVGEGLEADQARHDAAAKDTPPAESVALGSAAIHGFYAAVDDKTWDKINAAVDAAADRTSPAGLAESGLPSDWGKKSARTMLDTLHYEQPTVERALGRALARLMTVEDLKVLADFANGPAPAYFVKTAAAGKDAGKASPPPEVQAALQTFTKSGVTGRLGARFKDKDADKDKLIAIAVDAAQPLIARWMFRFGKELEAAPPSSAPH